MDVAAVGTYPTHYESRIFYIIFIMKAIDPIPAVNANISGYLRFPWKKLTAGP